MLAQWVVYKPPLVGNVGVVDVEAGGTIVDVESGSDVVVKLAIGRSLDGVTIWTAVVKVGLVAGTDVVGTDDAGTDDAETDTDRVDVA